MKPYWWAWSIAACILAAIMNTNTSLPSDAIKKDPFLLSIWARCFIIVAGLLAFISFFIPKIGLDKKYFDLAKKHINIPLTIWSGVCLLSLFMFIPLAVKNAGPVAIAIINLDFVLQLAFEYFVNKKLPSNLELIGTVTFIANVIFLAYAKSIK